MNHKIINQASILFNLIKKQNQKKKTFTIGICSKLCVYIHMYMYISIYIYSSIYIYMCRVAGAFREESYVLCALWY